MEKVLKIVVTLILMISYSCKAQQLLQTTADVQKLKTNELQFINKPLKFLLKEIKTEIKSAGVTHEERFSYFRFKFITIENQKNSIGSREDRVSLYIYM